MKVTYHPAADAEILQIGSYYAEIRPALGQDFERELERCVDRNSANPLQFEQVSPGVRRCQMQQFRYGVYFRILDENTVRIIVVRHHSRRPGFGLRRK